MTFVVDKVKNLSRGIWPSSEAKEELDIAVAVKSSDSEASGARLFWYYDNRFVHVEQYKDNTWRLNQAFPGENYWIRFTNRRIAEFDSPEEAILWLKVHGAV